jgi:hypothetical protein
MISKRQDEGTKFAAVAGNPGILATPWVLVLFKLKIEIGDA